MTDNERTIAKLKRHPRGPYGVGLIAMFLGVSSRTVHGWIDTGRLPGYRLPGKKCRRVMHESILEFFDAHPDYPRHPHFAADAGVT